MQHWSWAWGAWSWWRGYERRKRIWKSTRKEIYQETDYGGTVRTVTDLTQCMKHLLLTNYSMQLTQTCMSINFSLPSMSMTRVGRISKAPPRLDPAEVDLSAHLRKIRKETLQSESICFDVDDIEFSLEEHTNSDIDEFLRSSLWSVIISYRLC